MAGNHTYWAVKRNGFLFGWFDTRSQALGVAGMLNEETSGGFYVERWL